jgi:23S rRNA pseudouridine1911/1915/1917 synthase
MTEWVVQPSEGGARLDAFVARRLTLSRAAARRLCERGLVRVHGRRARKGQRVSAGERITLAESPPRPEDFAPVPDPEMALTVIATSAAWVAVAKPPGPASHPLVPGERGTVANAIVARFPECAHASADLREGGLVHRLDGGTSGVLVAARSRAAWHELRADFRAGRVHKQYLALVRGRVSAVSGTIDAPLGSRGRRQAVDPAGRPARTEWEVAERFAGDWLLLRVRTTTGRRHQVRAHLGYAELALAGDALYGGPPCPDLVGHFLHAERLTLADATTLSAALPPDRETVLARLRGGPADIRI